MLKKLIVILFLLFKAGTVFAVEGVAGDSAKLDSTVNGPVSQKISYTAYIIEQNKKRKAILRILQKYNSPMMQTVDTFMATCKQYDIDCYLLPSIAGLESGFGRQILSGSYNPFGWGGGYIIFNDWDQAIETVGNGLRNNYIGAGAHSIEQIGSKYAASPTWAARVRNYMAEFESAEDKNKLYFTESDLQL